MRKFLLVFALVGVASVSVVAQTETAAASGNQGVPRVVRFSGRLQPAAEASRGPKTAVEVVFSIYDQRTSDTPLWAETQSVAPDQDGKYSVLLGAGTEGGVPVDIFASGEARWLGVRSANGGPELERVQLVSVPYAVTAISAIDAQTLAGFSAKDFVLTKAASKRTSPESSAAPGPETSATVTNGGAPSGTVNVIPKWDGAATLTDSALAESGGFLGIGTTSPNSPIQVVSGATDFRFSLGASNLTPTISVINTNVGGKAAGFVSGTNGAGLLFDNTGYFTVASETKANFIGNNAGGGTINQLFTILPNGNVGLANPNPSAKFEVSSPSGTAVVFGNITPTTTGLENQNLIFRGTNNGGTYNAFELFRIKVISENGAAADSRVEFSQNGSVTPAMTMKGGNFGINVANPADKLDVLFTANGPGSVTVGNLPPAAIRGDTTSPNGVTAGVVGTAQGNAAIAVMGENLGAGLSSIGVYGLSVGSSTDVNFPGGNGVWGEATAGTGDSAGVFGRSASNTGTGVFGLATATSGDAVGVYGYSKANGGTGVYGLVDNGAGGNFAVYGLVKTPSISSAAGVFDTQTTAQILVGRAGVSPTNVFRVDSTGKGFFNGGTQTNGADFAESVAVRDEKSDYQPGDVIAIDTDGMRRFTKVAKPYSTLVAGIYSTKPGIVATPHHIDSQVPAQEEIPLAVVGIVPCKVSSENGPIQAGDLLVSSSTPGYAMKGTDRNRMNGAVIGKALQPMNGNSGVIEVLVSLQ
jgi:hypothetical protein